MSVAWPMAAKIFSNFDMFPIFDYNVEVQCTVCTLSSDPTLIKEGVQADAHVCVRVLSD